MASTLLYAIVVVSTKISAKIASKLLISHRISNANLSIFPVVLHRPISSETPNRQRNKHRPLLQAPTLRSAIRPEPKPSRGRTDLLRPLFRWHHLHAGGDPEAPRRHPPAQGAARLQVPRPDRRQLRPDQSDHQPARVQGVHPALGLAGGHPGPQERPRGSFEAPRTGCGARG